MSLKEDLASLMHCIHEGEPVNWDSARTAVKASRLELKRVLTRRGVVGVAVARDFREAMARADRCVRRRRRERVATYLELEEIVRNFRTGCAIQDWLDELWREAPDD